MIQIKLIERVEIFDFQCIFRMVSLAKYRSRDSATRSGTWSKYGCGSGCLPDLPSSSLTRPPEVRRLKTARKNRPKYGLYTVRFISRPIRQGAPITDEYIRRIYCPRDPSLYTARGDRENALCFRCWVQHELLFAEFAACLPTLLIVNKMTMILLRCDFKESSLSEKIGNSVAHSITNLFALYWFKWFSNVLLSH